MEIVNEPNSEEGMTREIQCRFVTGMPEKYQVPPTEIQLSTDSTSKDLSKIVKQLMLEEHEGDDAFAADLRSKKFNFMINETFLTLNIQELLLQLDLSNETVIDISYLFALEKPKPTQSNPCDEWISTIAPLGNILNDKAKSYCVGFFNGDVKVFGSGHAELLNVNQMHSDSQVTDMLYFHSDLMNAKIVVSCSELPDPQLTISQLSEDNKHIKVIARAKEEIIWDAPCGYTCLAQNPMTPEKFVSSSQIIDDADKGILLWEVNPETWQAQADSSAKTTAPMKRSKVSTPQIEPIAALRCSNGVQSMAWATSSVLIAGSTDHQIKVFDVERQQMQASVFTNHKVATCIDANFAGENQLILAGHEDGYVRLFDLRQAQVKQTKTFECHDRWVSQVKINPRAENVFVTAALDGQLKLWDMRNEQAPLYVLKRGGAQDAEDAKLFGLGWNGASQIISGGSDSHVSVHQM